MMHVDDADRVFHLIKLMGYAFLTALHAIDRAGKLTNDSELRDLGLVMTLYLKWSLGADDDADDEEPNSWREHVVAYAKKAGIDLRTVGCSTMERELKDIEDAEPLQNSTKLDRWEFKKMFKAYADDHGVRKGQIGGQQYNITKMSSRERAEYAFDRVDPLKDVPKDVLKENRLDFRV